MIDRLILNVFQLSSVICTEIQACKKIIQSEPQTRVEMRTIVCLILRRNPPKTNRIDLGLRYIMNHDERNG